MDYRFRLTAVTRSPGLLRIKAPDTSLDLPDGRKLYVVARETESLESAKKIHFEAGGYGTEQAATDAGNHLRLRLRLVNAALSLGLNVPAEDKPSLSIAQTKKEELNQRHSAEFMDSPWGLLVFPDDGHHAEYVVHAEVDVYPSDSLYWLDGLAQLWPSTFELDEMSLDALGLLNLASMETSGRNAFLVSYLALERLVPARRRDPIALEVLERFKQRIVKVARRKRRPLGEKERDSLLGSLGRLESESLGNSLVRMANHNTGAIVEGMPILDFVKACISARHATAHPSKRNDSLDYAKLTKGIRHVATSLMWSKHGIPDFGVTTPQSNVALPLMKERVVLYKQR